MRRTIWWFWLVAALMGIWLPLPILLSILLAYGTAKPKMWLVGLAIIAELLTALPFGILTVAIFIPLLARAWAKPQEPALRISFLVVLVGTTFIQYAILASFDAAQVVWQEGIFSLPRGIPWIDFTVGLLTTSLTAFGLFAMRNIFLPSTSRP